MMTLNERAKQIVQQMLADASALRIAAAPVDGVHVVDCGINVTGGLEAGRLLAEVCLAGLGRVELAPADASLIALPQVTVRTDQPLRACMAAQYAGWEVKGDDFFAMGSGPMRALGSREPLLDELSLRESSRVAVGVLEASLLPSSQVCQQLATACSVAADKLALLVAPTNSQAGTLQVVARSVETALHKLHELGYDLTKIESGWGTAPLPPVAKKTLDAIGRTNDAILYGSHVVLYLRDDDHRLTEIGPATPSSASADHGRPFREIFDRYDRDFYKIDKLLFSPAKVTLVNLASGRTHTWGEFAPDVLQRSFFS